ncbi:hypothetical protein ACFRFS_28665, partial [Streptomyces sp. NPDC056730]
LRVTALARPGLRRTIAHAHRSDVAPPRAARELQKVLLATQPAAPEGSGTAGGGGSGAPGRRASDRAR